LRSAQISLEDANFKEFYNGRTEETVTEERQRNDGNQALVGPYDVGVTLKATPLLILLRGTGYCLRLKSYLVVVSYMYMARRLMHRPTVTVYQLACSLVCRCGDEAVPSGGACIELRNFYPGT